MLEKAFVRKSPLKILIPTDLIIPLKSVSTILEQLGNKRLIDVALMHVIPLNWGILPHSNLKVMEKSITQELKVWCSKLPSPKKPYKTFVKEGNIAEEISLQAKKFKADLILFEEKKSKNIYTRGTSTVAQQIVRYSYKSVFICKGSKFLNVLCAVDGSKSSGNALKVAIKFCKYYSCKLTVLHVLPKIDFNPIGLDEHIVRRLNIEFKNNCIMKMDKFIKQFDFGSQKKVNILYKRNSPASSILETAEDKKSDLIILGAKGHSLMHDMFVGSTVEKVMPYSRCSLLIVR